MNAFQEVSPPEFSMQISFLRSSYITAFSISFVPSTRNAFDFDTEGYSDRTSVSTPAIETEDFRGFLQFIEANSGIVPRLTYDLLFDKPFQVIIQSKFTSVDVLPSRGVIHLQN